MLSTVAIILVALLRNLHEVSHELMEGNNLFFREILFKIQGFHIYHFSGFIRIGPQIF